MIVAFYHDDKTANGPTKFLSRYVWNAAIGEVWDSDLLELMLDGENGVDFGWRYMDFSWFLEMILIWMVRMVWYV